MYHSQQPGPPYAGPPPSQPQPGPSSVSLRPPARPSLPPPPTYHPPSMSTSFSNPSLMPQDPTGGLPGAATYNIPPPMVQPVPTPVRVKSKAYGTTLAVSSDDIKYQGKYKDLKRKVKEIEADNDKLHLKVLKTKRNIQRIRLERAILYERLAALGEIETPSAPATLQEHPSERYVNTRTSHVSYNDIPPPQVNSSQSQPVSRPYSNDTEPTRERSLGGTRDSSSQSTLHRQPTSPRIYPQNGVTPALPIIPQHPHSSSSLLHLPPQPLQPQDTQAHILPSSDNGAAEQETGVAMNGHTRTEQSYPPDSVALRVNRSSSPEGSAGMEVDV